ncbi:hypothetical protein LTR56_002148 [Elasticomyces elasticus]|nr:hypothetical protein LTR56_002148 [Elasticomyces elasticus]KAK3666027.1 hypothetical protein LTR22_003030 [Elasticomyces elasticus]KAK4929514.1 hypothetical protein LTR49_003809 [Elasticomyces elasticus]
MEPFTLILSGVISERAGSFSSIGNTTKHDPVIITATALYDLIKYGVKKARKARAERPETQHRTEHDEGDWSHNEGERVHEEGERFHEEGERFHEEGEGSMMRVKGFVGQTERSESNGCDGQRFA